MYAIVEISGKQYRIEKDAVVNVDKLSAESNSSVSLEKVLMVVDGEKVTVGKPYCANAKIAAKVVASFKGRKVRGMKFKRRKNYQRFKSDRREYTSLKIESFVVA